MANILIYFFEGYGQHTTYAILASTTCDFSILMKNYDFSSGEK